ncbi:MAG: hypothetical protein R3F62_09020 [Planctomycetota bacterium]
MQRSTILLAGLALLSACSSPQNRRGDSTQYGVTRADTLTLNEIDDAVKDLCKKASRKYAQGWPAHVALSPDDGRPLVRVGTLTKKIPRGHKRGVSMDQLRNSLFNALTEQDILSVVAGEEAMEDVDQDREQFEFDSGESAQFDPDQTTFVLRGEVGVEKLSGEGDEEGIDQYTYTLALQLWDTVKRRLVVATNTRVRKDRIE